MTVQGSEVGGIAAGSTRCGARRYAMAHLDAGAVPTASVVSSRGRGRRGRGMTVDPVDANEGADQPNEGAEEGKGNVGLPLGAGVDAVERDALPVKDVAVNPSVSKRESWGENEGQSDLPA